jgi:hypothetical protein
MAWAVVVGAALAGVWLARPGPITAADVEQPRLSQAAPVPADGASLLQSFTARHNGLSAVQVQAVVYGDPVAANGRLTLRLWGPGEALIAESVLSGLQHNQDGVGLSFPPLLDSAGTTYRLEVSGGQATQTSVWAYPPGGYAGGDLHQGTQLIPGDLKFKTVYTYLWPDMARDALRAAGRVGAMAVPLWLVLFAPGLALLDGLRPGAFGETRWARWGGALGLSLALLPLGWLWVTAIGLAWSPVTLGAAYAAVGALVAGRWLLAVARDVLRRRVRVRTAVFPGSQPVPVRFVTAHAPARLGRHDVAMASVLAAGLLLRLLAARDLALPAWVDSSHHALVASLLAASGRIPATYASLPGSGPFTYHFGVHTVLVALDWFLPLNLAETMLAAGQVLNALMPLAVYAGTLALTGRRRAGLLAAFYVGIVSFFPGYYVTWGRYSQLTGLLLLAPALGALWVLLTAAPNQAGRPLWRPAAVAGVLAAGLFLAHYRVFLFYLVFVLVAALLHLRQGRRAVAVLAAAALVGGVLALPWLGRMLATTMLPLVGAPGRLAAAEGYNVFPAGYFSSLLERAGYSLAVVAAAWGLLRRERAVWALSLWVGAVFALLNLGPGTWVVNNNAWAISLFLPAAMALGWGGDAWLTRTRHLLAAPPTLAGALPPWQQRARLGAGLVMAAAAAGLAAYAAAAGSPLQIGIVNPTTVLARSEDVAALDWIRDHTPESARFAVNGWRWLGESWAGQDGGAWILPYTGRSVTLPPVTYGFGGAALQRQVVDLAARVAAVQDANAAETLSLWEAAGVTHIFIGARGGNLKPEMFLASPHYRLLYQNGAAWVFEVLR